jgi:hypothetical protein
VATCRKLDERSRFEDMVENKAILMNAKHLEDIENNTIQEIETMKFLYSENQYN